MFLCTPQRLSLRPPPVGYIGQALRADRPPSISNELSGPIHQSERVCAFSGPFEHQEVTGHVSKASPPTPCSQ